ncbi:hypothetical protein ACGYKB_13760 [Sulfitobacter sp. 916]|uniref:hypothetical protein n=1 Tax=Sulfitobacter sp. 916 TaxID=3368559 RepID=UPI003745D99E
MLPTLNTPQCSHDHGQIAILKTFFHENIDALLCVTALAGGTRAHQRCLQLCCDVASAPKLTRPIRTELERLKEMLIQFQAESSEYQDELYNDHDQEAIDRMITGLESTLLEIEPEGLQISLYKLSEERP